jgi:phosphoglycolate phosphatase
MKLPHPHAVLFDWDNTLVDTWPTIHSALNVTLRQMEHPEWSLEAVKGNVKKSMREAFPAMFGDRWEEAAAHYQQSYRAIHLQHLAALAGAEQTLRQLRAAGLFVGIVTNKKTDTLRLELSALGWARYFDVTIGAGDAARDKPAPDPALLALADYDGARDAGVWFVGDTVVDLACAAAIGATPILYGDHTPVGATHDGHGFAAHVVDHAALQALFTGAGV